MPYLTFTYNLYLLLWCSEIECLQYPNTFYVTTSIIGRHAYEGMCVVSVCVRVAMVRIVLFVFIYFIKHVCFTISLLDLQKSFVVYKWKKKHGLQFIGIGRDTIQSIPFHTTHHPNAGTRKCTYCVGVR